MQVIGFHPRAMTWTMQQGELLVFQKLIREGLIEQASHRVAARRDAHDRPASAGILPSLHVTFIVVSLNPMTSPSQSRDGDRLVLINGQASRRRHPKSPPPRADTSRLLIIHFNTRCQE
ncbi:MAG TPA: hypothetical protein VGP12_00035, partial [Nitrosospira sp.]|nr:hypothetical protein [Nitrosospira sp.]